MTLFVVKFALEISNVRWARVAFASVARLFIGHFFKLPFAILRSL